MFLSIPDSRRSGKFRSDSFVARIFRSPDLSTLHRDKKFDGLKIFFKELLKSPERIDREYALPRLASPTRRRTSRLEVPKKLAHAYAAIGKTPEAKKVGSGAPRAPPQLEPSAYFFRCG